MKVKLSWTAFPLLLAFLLVVPQSLAQDDDGGFGSNVAGAWLGSGTFSVDLGCDGIIDIPNIPFTDAHNFGVGGSRVTTNPLNPNSNHGTWVKTGPRQVTGRDINFSADASNVGLITIVVDFDKRLETATTRFEGKFYSISQDPLDPIEVPWGCSIGEHTSFRKVSAIE